MLLLTDSTGSQRMGAVMSMRPVPVREAVEAAHRAALHELAEVQAKFAADVLGKGPVRAAQLHVKAAVRWETTVAVWEHAMETGHTWAGPDPDRWDRALEAANTMTIRLLRESATPTRVAVDAAIATVQAQTAVALLDEIHDMGRKAWARPDRCTRWYREET